MRTAPGSIEVHLKHVNRVALHHVMHYSSAAVIYDHSGSVINELLEMIVGFGVAAGYMMVNSVSRNEFTNVQNLTTASVEGGRSDGPCPPRAGAPDKEMWWRRRESNPADDALHGAPMVECRAFRLVDGAPSVVERIGTQRDAAEPLQTVADPVVAALENTLVLRRSGADGRAIRVITTDAS